MKNLHAELIEKYNVPTPRYTSYPTIPNWLDNLNQESWKNIAQKSFRVSNSKTGISIYIHLPYCESLCTYCGCNKIITTNHGVEKPYINTLIKEWAMYLALFDEKPRLKELHLGGGTPTFFLAENLEHLIQTILNSCDLDPSLELSFKAHPGITSLVHLQTLNKIGFTRISYSIQDFDYMVQRAINRFQNVQLLLKTTREARATGFTSINYDLVYGLPFQTIENFTETLSSVIYLCADQIAFHSYVHVPWTAKGQRLYSESNLPPADIKLKMRGLGKEMLLENGYYEIETDHFSLKTDTLFVAQNTEKLHRNFVGHTSNNTALVIGLGVSSISDVSEAYGQNFKTIEEYTKAIENDQFAFSTGHLLSAREKETRTYINQLMYNFEVSFGSEFYSYLPFSVKEKFAEMQDEGLLTFTENNIKVSVLGRSFVRNICTCLDSTLWDLEQSELRFSKGI